jgi:hypothetical protein
MNKKQIITAGYLSSALATLIGVSTAIGASSPHTIARATTVACIFGVFGICSFMFSLVAKD